MLIYITKKIFTFFLVLFLLSLISVAIIYFEPNSTFNGQSFFQLYYHFYQQILFNQFIIVDHTLWQVVAEIILPTFELCILAILGSIIIGIPVGIITGLTTSEKINHVIKFICLILYASPIVWVTVLVMFASSTDWAFIKNISYQPTTKSISILNVFFLVDTYNINMLLIEIKQLLLPIIILTIQPCIVTIQLISQRVSYTAQQNYIKVASIRDNSSFKVLIRHLLPNAIPSAIPQLVYNITTLLFYTMIVEILLGRSGLGTWVFSAFHQHNYMIIAISIFCCGALVSLLTLLSEIFIVLLYPIQSRSLYD